MPGSVVLLLSLLILVTGSDARRIRKRGLNHKVGLLTSPLRLFMSVWLCLALCCGLLGNTIEVEVVESSQYYSAIPALSQRASFTPFGRFCGGGERWSS